MANTISTMDLFELLDFIHGLPETKLRVLGISQSWDSQDITVFGEPSPKHMITGRRIDISLYVYEQ